MDKGLLVIKDGNIIPNSEAVMAQSELLPVFVDQKEKQDQNV
jgi:hypothetical protein